MTLFIGTLSKALNVFILSRIDATAAMVSLHHDASQLHCSRCEMPHLSPSISQVEIYFRTPAFYFIISKRETADSFGLSVRF